MFVYLDHIVTYTQSLQDHRKKFNKLAQRLKNTNLKLHLAKYEFLRRSNYNNNDSPKQINLN